MKNNSIKRIQSNTTQAFSNKVFSALLRNGEVGLDLISKEMKKASRPECFDQNIKSGKKIEKENHAETHIFEDNYKTPFTDEYYDKRKLQYSVTPEDNLEHFTTKKLNHFINDKPIGSKKHCGNLQKKESCFLIQVKRNQAGVTIPNVAGIARKKVVQDLFSGSPFEKLDQTKTSSIKIVKRENSQESNKKICVSLSQPKLSKLEAGNFVKLAPSPFIGKNKSSVNNFDTKITNKSMPTTPKRKTSLAIRSKGSLLPEKLNTTKSSPKSVRRELCCVQRDSSNVKIIMNNKNSKSKNSNLKEKISDFPFKSGNVTTQKKS